MRIFVYEHVSAGGLGRDAPTSLRREGQAMLTAVVDDFRRVPDVHVETGPDTFFGSDWALVIAPEFDDILSDVSQKVLDAGGRLLGSSPDAIRQTADKLGLAQYWQ